MGSGDACVCCLDTAAHSHHALKPTLAHTTHANVNGPACALGVMLLYVSYVCEPGITRGFQEMGSGDACDCCLDTAAHTHHALKPTLAHATHANVNGPACALGVMLLYVSYVCEPGITRGFQEMGSGDACDCCLDTAAHTHHALKPTLAHATHANVNGPACAPGAMLIYVSYVCEPGITCGILWLHAHGIPPYNHHPPPAPRKPRRTAKP